MADESYSRYYSAGLSATKEFRNFLGQQVAFRFRWFGHSATENLMLAVLTMACHAELNHLNCNAARLPVGAIAKSFLMGTPFAMYRAPRHYYESGLFS